MEPIEVTVSGETYRIEEASIMAAIRAVGIIAKHGRLLLPFLRKFADLPKDTGGLEALDRLFEAAGDLSPLFESPEDAVRFFAELSGIERERLELAKVGEFAEVAKAVFRQNNIMGLFSSSLGG